MCGHVGLQAPTPGESIRVVLETAGGREDIQLVLGAKIVVYVSEATLYVLIGHLIIYFLDICIRLFANNIFLLINSPLPVLLYIIAGYFNEFFLYLIAKQLNQI